MGKRKGRRIAAMVASRRVKLDIFAEPSGDSGGSPSHDELGGDIDPRHRDESPNSLSPSGKPPENPLSLLGQYSDDELEEQSSQQVATPEKVSVVDSEQINGPIITENEDKNGEEIVNADAPNDKEHDLDEHKPEQIVATEADGLIEEVSVEETPFSETVNVSSNVDVSTSWQLVLHEESGQYYYWNTVTGETSWVVPDVLASGTDLTGGQETALDAEKSSSPLAGVKQPNSALYRTDELEEKNEPEALMQEPMDEQEDDNLEDNKEGPDAGQASKCKRNLMGHDDNDLDNELCFSVLRQGEVLLEKFKSTEGSKSQMEENGWISRYILEVEIRLSDAKSLLSFGSSLLPFWVHSERKLKELEASFEAEVCQFFIDETQLVEATDASRKSEGVEIVTKENDIGEVVSDIEKSHESAYADISNAVEKDEQNEVAREYVISVEYTKLNPESSFEVNISRSKAAEVTEANPETTHRYEEGEIQDIDMDMDVDMEVEDANEPHFHPNPPVESIPLLPQEDFDVPPPPGEDWIPPPPPDSEPVPPPPPDDSAEPFYPPPPPDDQAEPSYPPLPMYPQTIQPVSYTDQYSFTYPTSSFEYYGQTPINNMYQQAEECHVAAPSPSVYYETIPSSYPCAAPVLANPVEAVKYYDIQDGTVVYGPVVSGAASSGLNGGSGHGVIGSSKISSLNSERDISHTSLSSAGLGGFAVKGGTEDESKGNSTFQTPSSVNNSVIKSGPMPSAAAPAITSDVAKSTVTNVQTKVLRSKKRAIAAAPTLRSNKKVSSLVDKWKAAKEELHEDEEDEPETAYDILEKKRQREIEKWKKQQIVSGEAKVNANFQPLGGDWRERVMRKRAQLKKEDTISPLEDITDVNKQPDLGDLSRDLPSGWQVYWDESSKQVYYGNAITSETTWTRPEK